MEFAGEGAWEEEVDRCFCAEGLVGWVVVGEREKERKGEGGKGGDGGRSGREEKGTNHSLL